MVFITIIVFISLGGEYFDDPNAFIFTLKNPHKIPSTHYMKRKESQYAIYCHYNYGPLFGNGYGHDISISCNYNQCTCSINNNCKNAYDCNSKYQSLLFTNSTSIKLFDYEVFIIDYQSEYTIYHMCKYPDIIWKYIQTNDISNEALSQVYEDKDGILHDLDLIRINYDNSIRKKIKLFIKNPSLFLPYTYLLDNQYDSYFKDWVGSNYKWKLIYRASQYKDNSGYFHGVCNDKTPTLIIMKSTDGWIFGGYTTQPWNYDYSQYSGISFSFSNNSIDYGYKHDNKAFIFTLKNPHEVEPTRFMSKQGYRYAIYCNGNNPVFGTKDGHDISIECNYGQCSYSIKNNCDNAYDCNYKYKSLLFTNLTSFQLYDYEVFTINYQCKYTVYHICKYPDIIWEYIQTNNISNESLSQVYDDKDGLLNDLDLIHINNEYIRLKIRKYVKSPSLFLPNTQIVDDIYDSYLREWIGNITMKLVYRKSEHEHNVELFHKYCDDKGPTLIVIKSYEGWIFGGYTTQSWNCNGNCICFTIY